MRRFLITIILFLNSFAFAQLKVIDTPTFKQVGKIAPLGMVSISLEKSEDNQIYCFDYKDIKFKHINEWKRFCFINENNDVDNLYNMIMDGFETMPEKPIKLESVDHFIYLTFEKNLGVISFQFYAENKATGVTGESPYMQKKQVMKLFGRSK